MELIKSAAHRTKFGDIAYFFLNIAFAATVLVLVQLFSPPYAAYGLILLSKWRIFAVRPRFWVANVKANIVDVIVGISIVALISQATGSAVAQIVIAAFFAVWLLVMKPRSGRRWAMIQAGTSLFLGIMAMFSFSHNYPVAFVVIAAWLVGFMAARHVLSAYHEDEETLLSLIWGLFVAQLAWFAYHWTIAYTVTGQLKVPMIALIVLLLSFVSAKLYDSYNRNDGTISFSDIREPVIFVTVVLVVLLVGFSGHNILTEL
jgi:hypothetical protein